MGVVTSEEAGRLVALDAASAARIDAKVTEFVAALDTRDVHSGRYRRLVADVCALGEREIAATAALSGRLLSRPNEAVSVLLSPTAPIARRLTQLRRVLQDVDPARYGVVDGGARRFLGLIPMRDGRAGYFERYAATQARIQAIVLALTDAREALIRDNAVISDEQRSLRLHMETLRQYAYMAERVDVALGAHIGASERTDPGAALVLQQDILFPVRQRRGDLLTQLAVAMQCDAALRVVEQNHLAVIRLIQTATTTTVAALRTAVMVAQALSDQRQMVERIAQANERASGMLRDARTLSDRAREVALAATDPGTGAAAVEGGWTRVFAVLDEIDAFKSAALAAMKVTASQLSATVERGSMSAEQLQRAASEQVGMSPPDAPALLSLERPVPG